MARHERAFRWTAGETITETLVSLLIGTIAIVMLVTAVVAAAHINNLAEFQTEQLWGAVSDNGGDEGELVEAERGNNNGKYIDKDGNKKDVSSKVTATNQTPGYIGSEQLDVHCYGGPDIVSYSPDGDSR